jgi:hypothetical protein
LEIYSYQVNIDNYTTILSSLPTDDVPERLANYMNTQLTDLPYDMSDEDIQLVSDYQYRTRLRLLLRTERGEQNKCQRLLDAMKIQIGPDADALISAYRDAQASATSSSSTT